MKASLRLMTEAMTTIARARRYAAEADRIGVVRFLAMKAAWLYVEARRYEAAGH